MYIARLVLCTCTNTLTPEKAQTSGQTVKQTVTSSGHVRGALTSAVAGLVVDDLVTAVTCVRLFDWSNLESVRLYDWLGAVVLKQHQTRDILSAVT